MVNDKKLDPEAVKARNETAAEAQREFWEMENRWEGNVVALETLTAIREWIGKYLGTNGQPGAGYKRLGQILMDRRSFTETVLWM